MYFDFEENRPDTPTLPTTMSWREVVLITVNLHLLGLVLILIGPRLPFVKAIEERRQAEIRRLQEQQQKERENAQFVFVQPRLDTPAPPPPRADLSDLDRRARTVERPPNPTNRMPFSRGNSPERIDNPPAPPARQPSADPPASPPPAPEPQPQPAAPEPSPRDLTAPPSTTGSLPRSAETARSQQNRQSGLGVLSDAIRNVQKYAQREGFSNIEGGGDQDFAPAIQFDTKGVEFGPWLRRFVAQIRSNWFIPYAAMSMKGHVVVTFFVHKDGTISDVSVLKPSPVDAFNRSAQNAVLASNPTQPLPPEYPDDRAFFTVTFFFNENPSGGSREPAS
jgi:TonB family protein